MFGNAEASIFFANRKSSVKIGMGGSAALRVNAGAHKRKRATSTHAEKQQRARERLSEKLNVDAGSGEDRAAELLKLFKEEEQAGSKEKADNMIKNLMTTHNPSHIELRCFFGVGAGRVERLAKTHGAAFIRQKKEKVSNPLLSFVLFLRAYVAVM